MIKPETAGDELRFERSAISWGTENPPTAGQRLSYDVGQTSERKRCAINLQTI
jgi:cold shock CspA family protein